MQGVVSEVVILMQVKQTYSSGVATVPCSVSYFIENAIFTVGEAVRSTCGNSHEEEEEEKNFHLSLLQTTL